MSQLISRLAGENYARMRLIQLICAVSIWRTAMTKLLPLCGTSAWWTTILCLLPGYALAVLLRLVIHLTGSSTLTEAVRSCLGKAGAWSIEAIFSAFLLLEAGSGLTSLITLFTEGVGTRGTAFTLALLTGGSLLLSLHRQGLPRATVLLRWPMLIAAGGLAVWMLSRARIDHLFPLYGDGRASVMGAVRAGYSLGWPIALLLTVPNGKTGRLKRTVLPVFAAPAMLFLLASDIPWELLGKTAGMAQLLLLPVKYAPNALRILYLGLLMTGMFLSICASVQLAAEQLCAPMKTKPFWLPYTILAVLVLTQAGDAAALIKGLYSVNGWLMLMLAGIAAICLPVAILRRTKK